MKRYDVRFFPNGRIYFLDNDLLSDAIEQEKEILIVMNAWSGGYAIAIGASKVPASWYDDNADPDSIAYDMYSYVVRDIEFSSDELSKFYTVIFTSGVMIRMKTGEQATAFQGGDFIDWDTSFEKFKQSFHYNGETKEEFEKLRFKVDIEATKNFMRNEENSEEKFEALKGYVVFRG